MGLRGFEPRSGGPEPPVIPSYTTAPADRKTEPSLKNILEITGKIDKCLQIDTINENNPY